MIYETYNPFQVYSNSTHYLTARGDLVVLDSSAIPRQGTRQTSSGTEERCEVTAAVEGLGEHGDGVKWDKSPC